MVRFSIALLTLTLLITGCGEAPPPEPSALLAAATEALGARDLDTIEYTGDGWDTSFGQAWSVQESWPRWALRGYNRVIDYGAGASRHTAERQAGLDPDKLGGGGAQPGASASTQQSNITADSSWAQRLVIYFTPYGFLKLAAEQDAVVEVATMEGRSFNVLAFDVADGDDTYQMRGYFNEDDVIEKIETRVDDAVMGDMLVEVEFSDYQPVGDGLLFPMHILESRGGLAFKELTVSSVVPNADVPEPQQAAAGGGRGGRGGGGGQGGGAAETEPSIQIGDGVWVVTGGYQSTVVEFSDHSIVIEGAQNAGRSQAIIAEAKRLTGDKPIRYFVTTHTHFDHINGIRDFVAEGATIIAHEMDVDFYEAALNTPHTINPDRAQEVGATATVMGVGDSYVLEDDSQRVELHKLNGSLHADDMMIAYIPSVGAIVEADLVQPWMNPAFGGGGDGPHPFLAFMQDELDRLGLDYQSFVSVHAPNPPPLVPRAEFEAAAQGGE